MGLIFRKRINLVGGLGLNISKSGFSVSLRTKYGSIGPRGYSIRSGIPGLTYMSKRKKNTKEANNSDNLFVVLFYYVPMLAIMTVGWLFWGVFKLISFTYKTITNDIQYLSSTFKLKETSRVDNIES